MSNLYLQRYKYVSSPIKAGECDKLIHNTFYCASKQKQKKHVGTPFPLVVLLY